MVDQMAGTVLQILHDSGPLVGWGGITCKARAVRYHRRAAPAGRSKCPRHWQPNLREFLSICEVVPAPCCSAIR